MTVIALRPRPPGLDLLSRAVIEKRSVTARYHGQDRLLCPHLLGWRNGRAKVLSYQAAAPTGDPRQHWRSMFVDELQDLAITDATWFTPVNYTANAVGIDLIEIAVEL